MSACFGRSAAALFICVSLAACTGGTVQFGSGSGYTRVQPARGDLVLVRPGVACDRFTGQCFATRAGTPSAFGVFPGDPFGSFGRPSSGAGRYVRTERDVVCDRRTAICYKDGRIDQSETRDAFGRDAARRADGIRDGFPGEVFVPRRGVVCEEDDQVCYKRGRPDRSETRDRFGKKAARRL